MNLAEMQAEVAQVNRDKGWYDEERTFGELIALLHSEASEALEAYRLWGVQDATPHVASDDEVLELLGIKPQFPEAKPYLPKPEGVGSELADVLIRLLDMCERYGIDLTAEVKNRPGQFGIRPNFGDQVCDLHKHISAVAFAQESLYFREDIGGWYAAVYVYLAQMAEADSIDLAAEYRRKVDYNKTRPYRHGGKKL